MTFQPRNIAVAETRARRSKRATSREPLLSVIVPVKDEEESVFAFVERVAPILEKIGRGEDWEILFIDDGSTDWFVTFRNRILRVGQDREKVRVQQSQIADSME